MPDEGDVSSAENVYSSAARLLVDHHLVLVALMCTDHELVTSDCLFAYLPGPCLLVVYWLHALPC